MHLNLAQTSTSSFELFMEVNCRSEKLRVHECFEFCILLGQKLELQQKQDRKRRFQQKERRKEGIGKNVNKDHIDSNHIVISSSHLVWNVRLRGCSHIMSANFGGFQTPSLDLKDIVAMQKGQVQLDFPWTEKMTRFNFLRQLYLI